MHPTFFPRLALLLLAGATILGAIPAQTAADLVAEASGPAWPMFQGDAAHTGYVPASLGAKPTFYLRWQRYLTGGELNPVVATGGKVFVSQRDYSLQPWFMALDARSGDTLWEKHYPNVNSTNPPSVSGGRVYFQTGNHEHDTYLRSYDLVTGKEVFASPHGAQWQRYFAPTIYDGTVYVNGGTYGGMYAFDARSGEERWYAALPQYDEWTPAVDDRYAYAYVGMSPAGLYVLDRHTGELAFQIPDPDFVWAGYSMNSAPVIGSTGAVLAAFHGRLLCFDIATRTIRWVHQVDNHIQPAVRDGKVYAIQSGSMVVLDEASGDLIWSWAPRYESLGGAILLTREHLIAAGEDALYALDRSSRKLAASYPAGGHLSLAGETLYVAQRDGKLLALGLGAPKVRTGTLVQFGKVKVGSSRKATLKVGSHGNRPLTVFEVKGLRPPFEYVGPALPLTIPRGETRTLTFAFAPDSRGVDAQRPALVSNDPDRSVVDVTLRGTGR